MSDQDDLVEHNLGYYLACFWLFLAALLYVFLGFWINFLKEPQERYVRISLLGLWLILMNIFLPPLGRYVALAVLIVFPLMNAGREFDAWVREEELIDT